MTFTAQELAKHLDQLHDLCFAANTPPNKDSLALWLQTNAAISSLEMLGCISDQLSDLNSAIDDLLSVIDKDTAASLISDIKQIKLNTAPD